MFKKLASSVKTAIQSKKTDETNANKKLNSIRDRITSEKEIERKNQRLKLVNDCRLNKNNNKASSNDSKLSAGVPVVESKLKRTTSDLSTLANESIASSNLDRRKQLEVWRKDRKERMLGLKDTQKPVFKVQHLGSKFFDSKSTSEIRDTKSANVSRSSSMLDSSRAYKFHDSIRHTSHTETHKLSRQNSIKNLNDEKYHFGSHSKFTPQFTFSVKVNSSDLLSHNSHGPKTASTPLLTAPKTSSLRRHESIDKGIAPKKLETGSKLKRTASESRPTKSTESHTHKKDQVKTTEIISGPVTRSKLAEMKSKETMKSTDQKAKISSTLETNLPPVQRIHKTKPSTVNSEDTKHSKATKSSPVVVAPDVEIKKDELLAKVDEIHSIKENLPIKPSQSKSRPSDLIKFDDENTGLPAMVTQPTIAETSFEDLTTIETKTHKDTVDHVIMRKSVHNLSKDFISTPKHSRQKEELENEFKNLTLSVKKTIKHFEDLSNSFSSQTNAENELSVKHFRNLVEMKTKELLDLSQLWTNICNQNSDVIPDDIGGDIRTACGLSKLLMDERFDQFSELINQCEATSRKNADPDVKVVKCSDLQGFWEMINHQVKDVENQFKKLEKIKDNNWSADYEPVQRAKKTAVRKQPVAKPASASTTAKTAAKSKFAEFRAQLKSKKATESDELHQSEIVEQEAQQVKIEEKPVQTKPTTPEEQKVQKAKKRSVIRSRPSDLIKFDSPVPMKRNNRNDVIAEHSEDEAAAEANNENDPFDFETYVPIVWSKNKPTSQSNQSPLTPNRNRTQLSNIANSPLLKLALVSSHGKTRKSQIF